MWIYNPALAGQRFERILRQQILKHVGVLKILGEFRDFREFGCSHLNAYPPGALNYPGQS
jgi:hypothetical protein